jgi:hypothetical protein
MKNITDFLNNKGIAFSFLSANQLFFRRPDGRGMYVREYPEDEYDWCVNHPHNDTNYMELRRPVKQSMAEALDAVQSFAG